MEIPFGGFLDSLPPGLNILFHTILLIAGLWVYRKAWLTNLPYASAFLFFVLSQAIFLVSWGGIITMKMAVLLEHICLLIMIVMIVRGAQRRIFM